MKDYIEKIKASLGRNINNIPGWRTNRKIVVIESDDWGSIRMPSKGVYNKMLALGIPVDQCPFCKYDSLASEEDLTLFFDLLLSHKDQNGKNPVITSNIIVANPDFERIRASNFTKYFYEVFTETLKRYPKHANSFDLMKQGMAQGIFYPQLHGREHLYVKRWLQVLRNKSKETNLAFDLNMFGVSTNVTRESRKTYLAAYDFEDQSELGEQLENLKDAQRLFYKLFDMKSKSFIAPNYTWSSEMERYLKEIGVEFIQGSRTQILAEGDKSTQKHKRHIIGERNSYGQTFLVRNCIFEPSTALKADVVSECFGQIESSFRWKKPAIISSHRLNYIGFINKRNRSNGLKLLNKLLTKIIKKWPDVEFMHSSELGSIISNEGSQRN